MKPKPEYYIPPEHEQKGMIANTPHWLREHFWKEGKKEVWKEIANILSSEYSDKKIMIEIIGRTHRNLKKEMEEK